MNQANVSEPAIVCVPMAIAPEERGPHRERARRLLLERALLREPQSDGYRLEFQQADLVELARFVDNERRCCPFISFRIDLEPEDGALTLTMSGPPGTREVLDAELDLDQGCGCNCK
jgi:hypothetical protein